MTAQRASAVSVRRVYDGKDMSEVLLKPGGRSPHAVLFLYNQDPNMCTDGGPSAARMVPAYQPNTALLLLLSKSPVWEKNDHFAKTGSGRT